MLSLHAWALDLIRGKEKGFSGKRVEGEEASLGTSENATSVPIQRRGVTVFYVVMDFSLKRGVCQSNLMLSKKLRRMHKDIVVVKL